MQKSPVNNLTLTSRPSSPGGPFPPRWGETVPVSLAQNSSSTPGGGHHSTRSRPAADGRRTGTVGRHFFRPSSMCRFGGDLARVCVRRKRNERGGRYIDWRGRRASRRERRRRRSTDVSWRLTPEGWTSARELFEEKWRSPGGG